MEKKKELPDIIKSLSTEQDIDKTKDELKVFLVAQARRELERVVTMTQLLDSVEDKYQEAVNKFMYDNPDKVMFIAPSIMETILTSLQRSNDLIKQVLGNDKLFDVLVLDQSKTVTVNVAENLSDARSRSRVISGVSKIIELIKQEEEIKGGDVGGTEEDTKGTADTTL